MHKNENFVKNSHFSKIFSIIFIILMEFFKITPNLRAFPKSKILSRQSKNGPAQTFGGPPQSKNPACITEPVPVEII